MQMNNYDQFVDAVKAIVKKTDAEESTGVDDRDVLGMRFKLGAQSDARYLNAGVAVLWSCIDETKDEYKLAPESLYSVDAAAAVTRRAAMRALEVANARKQTDAVELRTQVWSVIQSLKVSNGKEFNETLEAIIASFRGADGNGVPTPEEMLAICAGLLELLKAGQRQPCKPEGDSDDGAGVAGAEDGGGGGAGGQDESKPRPSTRILRRMRRRQQARQGPNAGGGQVAEGDEGGDAGDEPEEEGSGSEQNEEETKPGRARRLLGGLFGRGGGPGEPAMEHCAVRGLVGFRGPHQPQSANPKTADERIAYAHPKLQDGQLHARLRLLQRVCDQRGVGARVGEQCAASSMNDALDAGFSLADAAAEIVLESHGHCTNQGLKTSRTVDFDVEHATHGILEELRKVEWMPRASCALSELVATAAALEHEHLSKHAIAAALEPKPAKPANPGATEPSTPSTPSSTATLLRAQSFVAKMRQVPLLQWMSTLTEAESELVRRHLAPSVPMTTRPCYVDRNGKLHTSGYPVAVEGGEDVANILAKASNASAFENARTNARMSANPATGTFEFPDSAFVSVGVTPLPHQPFTTVGAISDAERQFLDVLQRQAAEVLSASEGDGDATNGRLFLDLSRMRLILQLGVEVATQELATEEAIKRAKSDEEKAKNEAAKPENNPAIQRRAGLWTEFMRSLAIGHDPLWVFVKTLSGFLGEDINSVITMADDAAIRASRAIQQQKLAIAKRVSETQARIVETIVTALAKDSRLAFDKNSEGALVVVDNETRAQLKELASGTSGRPFFEASQALTALRVGDPSKQTTLEALLDDVTKAGHAIQRQLIDNMAGLTDASTSGFGAGMASLAELSQPHNSFFVNMKPDVVAALKSAHDKLSVEMAFQGVREIKLWELVEGGCDDLSMRFAETTALVLAQLRASGGVNAMYVPKHAIETNALQARMSMTKLSNLAAAYATRVSAPSPPAGGGDGVKERDDQIASAQKVRARDALAIAGIDPSAARRHGRGAKRPLPYAIPEAGGRWLGYH
jgi:hypothetical protein